MSRLATGVDSELGGSGVKLEVIAINSTNGTEMKDFCIVGATLCGCPVLLDGAGTGALPLPIGILIDYHLCISRVGKVVPNLKARCVLQLFEYRSSN